MNAIYTGQSMNATMHDNLYGMVSYILRESIVSDCDDCGGSSGGGIYTFRGCVSWDTLTHHTVSRLQFGSFFVFCPRGPTVYACSLPVVMLA